MDNEQQPPRAWKDMSEEERAEASAYALLQIPRRMLDLTEALQGMTLAFNALAESNEALANSVMELVSDDEEEADESEGHL